MKRTLSVVAVAALSLVSSLAQAASQSSATISGLTFSLIDLNPNDGIAPSFSFLTTTGTTALTLSANDGGLVEAESMSTSRPGTFSFTREQLASITNAYAKGALSSESLSVSGAASGPSTSYSGSASTGSPQSYYYYSTLNLSLSANTLLMIDADIKLKAEASNAAACNSYYYYCSSTEIANATAVSTLSYNYSGGNVSSQYNGTQSRTLQATASGGVTSSYYQYDNATGSYRYVTTTTPASDGYKVLDESLRSVFSNSSNMTQAAAFGLSVSVSGQAMSAAIPEPATYALMLQGLLAGGWLVRRSRRAA
ncbi:MAG: PEP-CTERM sorting domain-containing protein [Aquabacterium sp.]|nr:PEP-CTERM sorting domain-containing protein [Aquabacterium sp.]